MATVATNVFARTNTEEEVYPLTPMQRAMLVESLAAPNSGIYVQQMLWSLRETLDIPALAEAWRWVIAQHAALRTSFRRDREFEAQQVVHAQVEVPLVQLDVRQVREADREARVLAYRRADARRGFDLSRPPCMRLALFRISDRESRLLWTFHQALLDGHSRATITRQVLTAYDACRIGRDLEPLPTAAFSDFVRWQGGPAISAAESHWRSALAGSQLPSPLPLAQPRESDDYEHAEVGSRLTAETSARIGAFAHAQGVAVSTVFNAAWALLLSAHTRQSDVVFGEARACRHSAPGSEHMVGMLMNAVPLRVAVSPEQCVGEWLRAIRAAQLGARDYERTSLFDIQKWAGLPRQRRVFDSVVVHNRHDLVDRSDVEPWRNRDFSVVERTEYPLVLQVYGGSEIRLKIDHHRNTIASSAAALLLAQLVAVVRQIISNAEAQVRTLTVAVEASGNADGASPARVNGTRPATTAQERVARQAARTPDAVALRCAEQTLTYRELNERANQIAHRLIATGVRPGQLVSICAERSTDLAVAVLAALKSGAAYLPIDPSYPAERIAFVLRNAVAEVVLTQPELVDRLGLRDRKIVSLSDDFSAEPATNPVVEIEPQHPAYVIYTSGSTGEPKGVTITHDNLSHYLDALPASIGVRSDDVYLHTASIAFSSSVRQLFVPLSLGAQCVIATRELTENPLALFSEIKQRGVTVIDLVPSYWRVCNHALKSLCASDREQLLDNRLRLLLSASEPLPTDVVQEWRSLGLRMPAINMFGQTETTGIVATYPIPEDVSQLGRIVPVGRALSDTQLYVLDDAGQPVSNGYTGAVYVGGRGVGAGYLNRADLTSERFVEHPTKPGVRVYSTGDRGRMGADGSLEFVGRGDAQVKIRGHRVELEEVEAGLRAYSAIREAAALAKVDTSGETRLVACLALTPGQAPSLAQLRRHLQRTLPDYMIPTQFALVEKLPRTPNGKLDRRALSEFEPSSWLGSANYVAPRTETEKLIAGIWADLLEVPRVGVHDGFLELGGHSLMAHRVAVRLRQALGVELPLREILQAATVEQLATRIDAASSAPATQLPPITPITRAEELPLSNPQQRLWLLAQINPNSTAYNLSAGLRLVGELNVAALERAISEVVRRHESLRTIFPTRNGVAVQIITPAEPVTLPLIELTPDGAVDERARSLSEEEVRRVFDLEAGPLFRALLLRKAEHEHVLVITMHHIISDGWSRGVLYREIAELYSAFSDGLSSPLSDLPIQYVDYADWQRTWLDSGVVAGQLEYWKQHLAGALPLLDLPTDRPRPPMQTTAGATYRFELPAVLAEQLRAVGAQENATLFMTLLAAFQTLLHRYSGQTDIVVGTPVAGRNHLETEQLIGFFVNTLVMRADLSGEPTFRALLQRVREVAHAAYDHQDVPFEKLVEELGAARDLSRSPIFQTMFILQNTPTRPFHLRGLSLDNVELDAGAAKFDLTLSVVVEDNGLTGSIEYSTDLFDAGTIERMSGHYRKLLEGIVANADATIAELPLLTDAEQEQVLEQIDATRVSFPADMCVHQLFEQQVVRTPDATAVVFEGNALSYRELNERANQVAHHLMRLGVGPDSLVGISVPRSIEMMVGLLGIHKAGAAYVPLDPSYPRERLAVMIEDSGVALLLSLKSHARDLPSASARVILLDADADFFATESKDNPRSGATADNLAYVIYTSGSTGKPKGVMVEHRNVVNFFTGMDERLGTEPGTWLAVTSISFDISVLELFWSLTRGYKVVVQSEEGVLAGGALTEVSQTRTIDFGLFYFASNESANASDKYRLLLEGARFADANGFSSVWTPERHFHSFGGLYPNPSVTSAAVAAITKNVQIRAGSVVLPLHNPLRVAEEWSVVDNLSNGRVGLAFASGWHDRDFVFMPQNYADRRNIMMESIETVRKLWRGESIKAVTGAGKETDVSVLPRPIQKELPIWITAAGTPDTYKQAGQIGANVLTHLLGQTIEQLRDKIEIYRQARREAGHEGDGIVSLMMHTYVGENLEDVRARVFHPFREYLRTSVGLVKDLAEGRGQDLRGMSKEDMEGLLDHAFDRYWQTAALLGTPETCLEVVNKLKEIGVDEVACLIDFGVDEQATLESFERLAELKQRANTRTKVEDTDYSVGAQILRHRITHLQCTPSLATMLLQQPGSRRAFSNLRKIMIGGEAFPPALAAELRRVTSAEIVNMYGPTETTIWSSTHSVNGKETQIPLGQPIANTQFYVLDSAQRPVPMGVPGELYIGGAGVVRGYWNRRELTAERFPADKFQGSGKLYRTGDLVRYRSSGELDFLGRTDFQVKILGHRIELGEIEAAIARRPEVRECVVVAREAAGGDKRLAAYVVGRADRGVDVGALRAALRSELPEFMVPAHIVVLPDLPRTPNNKVDRKALPAPELLATKLPLGEFTAPSNDMERQIAGVWQEILRVPHVGATDNFFDLGGNSFLAVRVHTKLRSELKVNMPLTTLFRFPTVGALAAHLGGGSTSPEAQQPVESGADRAELRRQAMRRRRQLQ
jgi:natural product biosynthesis luciferase-like monooxygenase protein/amino acid adenylation domain-containing protein